MKTLFTHVSFVLLFLTILLFKNNIIYAAPCGNGVCQTSQNETCSSCSIDCGTCNEPTPTPNPTPTPTATPTTEPTNTPTTEPTPIPSATPGSENLNTQSENSSNATNEQNSSGSTSQPVITYYPQLGFISTPPIITNSPTIVASGNTNIEKGSVKSVEYSFTNGAEWFSIPIINNFFAISIKNLSEGKYNFQLRAISSENVYTQLSNYLKFSTTIALTPPEIRLDYSNQGPTNDTTPTITGFVKTSLATLTKLEYSLNNGESWITMPNDNSFSLTLPELNDGNYTLIFRATDSAKNQTTSKDINLIIDTIPPTFGGMSLTTGHQTLDELAGNLEVFPNISTIINLSFNGGVTQAKIKIGDKIFSLKPNPGGRIWQTELSQLPVGEQQIELSAQDGAGNNITKILAPINVIQPNKVVDLETNEPLYETQATIYYYDPTYNKQVLWDAKAYGQENPITLNDGTVGFFLPKGRFFIDFTQKNYRKAQTNTFELQKTSLISFPVSMVKNKNNLNSLPILDNIINLLFPKEINLENTVVALAEKNIPKVSNYTDTLNKKIPDKFQFSNVDQSQPNLNQDTIEPDSLIIFVAPWSADSQALISFLNRYVKENPQTFSKISLIFPHESKASVSSLFKRGNYNLQAFIDPTGTDSNLFDLRYLPQSVLISKTLTIQQIEFGKNLIPDLLEKITN